MRTAIFKRIADVPRAAWDELMASASATMSWAFWEVIERSGLEGFDYRYLMFYDEADRAVAATAFYTVTTDIAIFAPTWLRAILQNIRRVFPNFLKWKMLECGTPITINSPPFALLAGTDAGAVIDSIHRVLRETARKEGQLLIVVRDFEPNALNLQDRFAQHGYHWIDSLPNTYLDIRWQTPLHYMQSMRSYYRSKLQKHLKRNVQAGVSHKLVDDFEDLAETLCRQWLVVHTHASEYQREVLTPAFYREFSRGLGEASKALLFYRGGDLIGHALLLVDGDMLRWLYVGREVAANDSLYLYIAHKVIETGILLGMKRVEMGLTTYAIKQDLGADVVADRFALRASWGVINPFVGLGYSLLNSVPKTNPRPVFKAERT